jgi:hypothetical protein
MARRFRGAAMRLARRSMPRTASATTTSIDVCVDRPEVLPFQSR